MSDYAGLALSIPGLIFTCVQYYEAFFTYANSQKEREDLCVRFAIEDKIFSNWRAKEMPDNRTVATSDPTLVKLTMNCLDQIKSAFEEYVKISNSSQDVNHDWVVSMDSLRSTLQRVGWALNGSKTTLEIKRRFRSATSTALIGQFRQCQRPEVDGDGTWKSGLIEYQELAAAVRLRRIVLEAKDREGECLHAGQTIPYLGQLGDNLELDAGAFHPSISTETPNLPRTAAVNGQDALLEWKVYKTDTPTNMNRRQYEWLVRSSIRSLAKLLSQTPKPAGLRALNCLGFFEPPARGLGSPVCFAFSPPHLAYREPISLAKLIEESKKVFDHGGVSIDGYLFLGDRFALATTLARAVQQLHDLGWLHKGIRSQNVLFYRPSNVEGVWRPNPRDLYLVGYEFARPASEAGLSMPVENRSGVAIYHHPSYADSQNARYEPRFDLYSLGIVLIEIAFGKTATEMAEHGRVDTSSPWEWDLYIAHFLLSEVEKKMGKVYGEVVQHCIKGDVGNDNLDGDYKAYLKSLDADIVGKLELCYA